MASRDSKNCSRGYREERLTRAGARSRDRRIVSWTGGSFPEIASAWISNPAALRLVTNTDTDHSWLAALTGSPRKNRRRAVLRPAADQLGLAGFIQPLIVTGDAMQIAVHLSGVAARWRTSGSMRRWRSQSTEISTRNPLGFDRAPAMHGCLRTLRGEPGTSILRSE